MAFAAGELRNRHHVPTLSPIDSVEHSPSSSDTGAVSSDSHNSKVSSRPKLLAIPSLFSKKSSSNGNLSSAENEVQSSGSSSQYERKPIFEAESPDELALVDASYTYRFRLLKRTPTQVNCLQCTIY